MKSRRPWFVHRRTLICSVCAIAVLSGLGLILTEGRSGSAVLFTLFIFATLAVLFVILHAITLLAQRTIGTSMPSHKDDHETHDTNASPRR